MQFVHKMHIQNERRMSNGKAMLLLKSHKVEMWFFYRKYGIWNTRSAHCERMKWEQCIWNSIIDLIEFSPSHAIIWSYEKKKPFLSRNSRMPFEIGIAETQIRPVDFWIRNLSELICSCCRNNWLTKCAMNLSPTFLANIEFLGKTHWMTRKAQKSNTRFPLDSQ